MILTVKKSTFTNDKINIFILLLSQTKSSGSIVHFYEFSLCKFRWKWVSCRLPVSSRLQNALWDRLGANNQIFTLFLPRIQLSETKFKASSSQVSPILPGNTELKYQAKDNF